MYSLSFQEGETYFCTVFFRNEKYAQIALLTQFLHNTKLKFAS